MWLRLVVLLALINAGLPLSGEVLESILIISKERSSELSVTHCSDPILAELKLLVYNRDYPKLATTLVTPDGKVHLSRSQYKFIFHGWLENSTTVWVRQMKDAYLNKTDCDVVVVDWSRYGADGYEKTVCQLLKLSKILGGYLLALNLQLWKTHMIGHSMGAHLAGLVGKEIANITGHKVARITGLDPSGPMFNERRPNQRLDKTDADFVDVIHTDGSHFGTLKKMGQADFWPNCGYDQPSCPSKIDDLTLETVQNHLDSVFCGQRASVYLFIESIRSESLEASRCAACFLQLMCSVTTPKVKMGEHCPKVTGNYYLKTPRIEIPKLK